MESKSLIRTANKLRREGKLVEAIAMYRQAIQLNPSFSWYYHNLAETLLTLDKVDEAINEYHLAIEANPHSISHYRGLQKAFAKKGKSHEAELYFQKLRKLKGTFDSVDDNSKALNRYLLNDRELEIITKYQDGNFIRRYRNFFLDELFEFKKKIHKYDGLNSIFMPPAGFPTVHGYFIDEIAEINLSEISDSNDYYAFKIDLFLPKTFAEINFELSFNNCTISTCRNNNICHVKVADKFECYVEGKFISFSLRYIEKNWMVAVNDNIFNINEVFKNLGKLPPISLNLHQGQVGIIQYQYIGEKLSKFIDYSHKSSETQPICQTSPIFVRKWENGARCTYNLAIGAMILYQISQYQKDRAASNKLEKIMKQMLEALSAWPYWRPSNSLDPELSDWERGNWSNGFLPGAYGILLTTLEKTLLPEKHLQAQQTLMEKGLNWLVSYKENSDKTLSKYRNRMFPSPQHWIKRSTNHGLVILATAWIGSFLALGAKESLVDDMLKDYWEVFNESFSEGLYLEGIWYAEFVLLESLLLFWIQARTQNKSIGEYLSKSVPCLKAVKEFFQRSSNQSGLKVATFGDCYRFPWINAVIYLLENIQDDSSLKKCLVNTHRLDQFSISNHACPHAPFAVLLAEQNSDCSNRDESELLPVSTQIYSKANVAHVIAGNNPNQITELWLFGSTLHLTHNKSYDLCSFILTYKEEIILDRQEANRQETNDHNLGLRPGYIHNTVGLKGIACESDADDFNCMGGVNEKGGFIPRNISGRIDGAIEKEDHHILTATARGLVISDPRKNAEICEFSRAIILTKSGDLMLLLDFVQKKGPGNVYFNFNLPYNLISDRTQEGDYNILRLANGVTFDFFTDNASTLTPESMFQQYLSIDGSQKSDLLWKDTFCVQDKCNNPRNYVRLINEIIPANDTHDNNYNTVSVPMAIIMGGDLKVSVSVKKGRKFNIWEFGDSLGRTFTLEVSNKLSIRYSENRFLLTRL